MVTVWSAGNNHRAAAGCTTESGLTFRRTIPSGCAALAILKCRRFCTTASPVPSATLLAFAIPGTHRLHSAEKHACHQEQTQYEDGEALRHPWVL
jgi:hypothetical protein